MKKQFLSCCPSCAFFMLIISCVPSDDFEVPETAVVKEIVLETTTDLDAILGAFNQSPEDVDIVTFEDDLIIEAFVVSSDEAGNFYKELILQNSPNSPTAGIAVQINQTSYYETFDFGRRVYVRLKGLSIGLVNGVLALGMANGKVIEQIPLSRIQEFIIRTSEVVEIVPKEVDALEFNDRLENLYLQVNEVQFSRFLVNPENLFTFASEDNDEFDGERLVESCGGGFPFILSTSTFADFKSFDLPIGSGYLKGILTRDFYNEFFTIYLNSSSDIDFSTELRCDAASLDCGLASTQGRRTLFKEDFETQKNNAAISGNGWINFVQEGSEPWEGFTATGANTSLGVSARVQTSGSGDYKTVSWLITPPINFNAQANEFLQFKTSTSFGNLSMLEVFFSNDWNGDLATFDSATWKVLSSAYVAKVTDFFGEWIPSGKVSLGCATGTGYIGFRFTGSDLIYYDGVYELDDIVIGAD